MKNRWRFNFCLLIHAITFLCWYVSHSMGYDAINLLLEYDITFISLIILFLYIVSSIWIDIHLLVGSHRDVCDWPIFVSENLVTIGMLGTLIGLMIALGSLFGLNLTDAHEAAIGIQKMAVGVSVAMTTTLVGIICSLFLNIQLLLWNKTLTIVENDFVASNIE